MTIRGSVGRLRRRLEPPPRLVDWSLFLFVVLEVLTGLVSFTVAVPAGWPWFWVHRVLGLAIVVLLGFKLSRVAYRVTDRGEWQPSTLLSVCTAIVAVGALVTGIAWVAGLDVRIARWTLLSVHVGFGFLLVPLVLFHMYTRFRRPERRDFEGRRTAIQYTGLFVFGAVLYRLQTIANALLRTAGADRRVTGSQPREGTGNDSFPVTSWVADDPAPIDREQYRLAVTGAVETPIELPVSAVDAGDEHEALLDCTSGWYTVQQWRGVRVGDLLEATGGIEGSPAWVRFVSVTGYRWSLPLAEAREALLATHVGGEALSHGHGGPVRLVAPGRRGFQWVKWVTRVEVRTTRDPAQWVVTLISGFD